MMAGKKIWGREFWVATVAEFEAMGGVNRREFVRSRGLNYHTFNDWIYRLRREQRQLERADGEPCEEAIRFIELELDSFASVAAPAALVIEFASARVHFVRLPQPAWLAQFFGQMQAGQGGGPC
jgi:hypothetical protein